MSTPIPTMPDQKDRFIPSSATRARLRRQEFEKQEKAETPLAKILHVRPGQPSPLRKYIFMGMAAFAAYAAYVAWKGNFSGAVAGAVVILCSLIPTVIWLSGKAKGFPIYPVYASTFISAFGMQMINNKQLIENTEPSLFWATSVSICLFLLLSTAVWFAVVKKPKKLPPTVMVIGGHRTQPVLLGCMTVATLCMLASASGWLDFLGNWNTLMRAFMFCLNALSCFILSYEIGAKTLLRGKKTYFLTLVGISMAANATNFLLVQSMGIFVLCIAGYTIASQKIPWKVLTFFFLLMTILHYGKYPMREKYWSEDGTELNRGAFQPKDYPRLFTEWFGYGLDYLRKPSKARVEERSNLIERSGLLHLYIFVQRQDDFMPLLGGATYAILPQLLLPRILVKDKATSHETTSILNIYFGIQSREDTSNTTIGWGLFNEAYANFGYFGLAGLAVVLGLFFGYVTRYSMGCPITSFQGLVAISVMNVAYQSEYSSGVFVTVLFQSIVVLIGLRYVIMQPVKLDSRLIKNSLGGI